MVLYIDVATIPGGCPDDCSLSVSQSKVISASCQCPVDAVKAHSVALKRVPLSLLCLAFVWCRAGLQQRSAPHSQGLSFSLVQEGSRRSSVGSFQIIESFRTIETSYALVLIVIEDD